MRQIKKFTTLLYKTMIAICFQNLISQYLMSRSLIGTRIQAALCMYPQPIITLERQASEVAYFQSWQLDEITVRLNKALKPTRFRYAPAVGLALRYTA
jgi:hypothetical protein